MYKGGFMRTHFSIITERLNIREVKSTDDKTILLAMSCPDITDMYSGGFETIIKVQEYIAVLIHEYENENIKYRTLAIADRKSDELYGAITIDKHSFFPRAELSYWISIPNRKQGYATEAVSAIIKYGFSSLNLSRIQATHSTKNPASGRVLEKSGMIYEGTLRHYYEFNNIPRDEKMYSIIKGDIS
jgi:ribosomal-protein-alanine N-acetyltransferase